MSSVTRVLQLLQVLTAMTGCNIYTFTYSPRIDGKRPFRVHKTLNKVVRAMHRFWLRPWLLSVFMMNIFKITRLFLEAVADDTPGSRRPIDLIYILASICAANQNIIISVAIYYNYRYKCDRMRLVLDEFAWIYQQYTLISGQEISINWWFFFVVTFRMFIASIMPIMGFFYLGIQPLGFLMKSSFIVFVCIQPFLLSMVAYVGFFILHSCYGIGNMKHLRRKYLLFDYYIHLIKLRQNFDHLLRPFAWAAFFEMFIIFTFLFHFGIYKKHSVRSFITKSFFTLCWPMHFLYITVSIRKAEQKFVRFRANFKPQRQAQSFWLSRVVMQTAGDRSELRVFRPNRTIVLEILSFGWIYSMFTNSIMISNEVGTVHIRDRVFKT